MPLLDTVCLTCPPPLYVMGLFFYVQSFHSLIGFRFSDISVLIRILCALTNNNFQFKLAKTIKIFIFLT